MMWILADLFPVSTLSSAGTGSALLLLTITQRQMKTQVVDGNSI